MDKENDISGSLDCVFKVPMDPNTLKSQEQFYFWEGHDTTDLTVVSLENYFRIEWLE